MPRRSWPDHGEWEADGATYAHADFVGELREICLNLLPGLEVGDHTIPHASSALTKVASQEAS